MLRRLRHTVGIRYASSKVLGIDLGTTNSAVAYIRDSNDISSATIIENDQGQRTTPSVVAYDKYGNTLVGVAAKRQSHLNTHNTFFATKRLIGRQYTDADVQQDLKNLPYRIVESDSGGLAYLETTFGQKKSPSQVASAILNYLKRAAEDYLGEKLDKTVITVPAYFSDAQRQATKDAGSMAGMQVLRVVNEPTAAALSFGLNTKSDGVVAVYDLGGGTFDISILDIEDGVFEVRATNGDTHLGGEDFDNIVVDHLLAQFAKQHDDVSLAALKTDQEVVQRVREAAEKAKIALSHVKETEINIPFLYEGKHLVSIMREEELDAMTLHLIERTIGPVKKALRDADMEPTDIDEVILVGGMTRMPKIRHIVGELFKKKPTTSVNPDETVALGAAIQGGILSGEIKNVLLLDVTPLTLGIETYGGVFSPLIPRNTIVPVKKTEVFSTGIDGQTSVDIRVFQGERGLVNDNILIGEFKLAGIPPKPKGVPQIHVTFDIDADGIINVSASEVTSNTSQTITVIPKSGLTDDEIQQMISDANANSDRDQLLRQRIEMISRVEPGIEDIAQSFQTYKERVKEDADYERVLQALTDLQARIQGFRAKNTDLSIDVNAIVKDAEQLRASAVELLVRSNKAHATKTS
ncbi:AFR583Wp [Eremothecium gossypii ATCC 10895]|uniref:non-chaperonin molecular chaperone ATPase n=1 Tax=Eremothecium gossypii (strain ATCC 10895 / CBS 109.51 / FGSC 9923 / NRRL Y-1056) TaxID=284811 RepID=Q752J2_EREGS|nr:AFR583Wp [Eremothecium gossypii ATCC 10895]AAS53954.1 AFR583Wp [Eremothecium gossypii ATCC 10895]